MKSRKLELIEGTVSARPIPLSHANGAWTREQNQDERLYALWDELSDFGAHDTDAALKYCMHRACAWIGGHDAFWVGAVRGLGDRRHTDSLMGWRIGALEALSPDRERYKRLRSWSKAQHSNDSAVTFQALVSGAGSFRARSLRTGLAHLDPFQRKAYCDRVYQQLGIADRLWVAFPVGAFAESYFCFDSYEPKQYFDEHALRTAADIFRGIKWFHRELLLSHGLGAGGEPISPAVRRVLHELLSGATEKSIAKRLRITPASTHQYVKTLFRHFGVHGRAEFMSLWLSRRS